MGPGGAYADVLEIDEMAVPRANLLMPLNHVTGGVFLPLLIALGSCVSSSTGPDDGGGGGGGEPGPVVAIEVENAVESSTVGATIPISVLLKDADGDGVAGTTVSWSASSGASVEPAVSVSDADGVAGTQVTLGMTPGTYQASAVVGELAERTIEISAVAGRVATIELSTDSLRFTEAGQTERVEAVVSDEFGNPIDSAALAWSSADPGVATVENGMVTAVGQGRVSITATSGEASAETTAYVRPYGYFTVTFDDGFESTYTVAYPALNDAGLRANVAVNPKAIDQQWETYLTFDQLSELHAEGWAVVNHTLTHPRLPQLSAAEMEAEILQARDWIRAKGFRGADVFIVPYHEWGDREMDVIRRTHAAARGHSSNPPWLMPFQEWPADDPYMLTGFEPEVYEVESETSYTSAAVREEIVRRLDGVIERGEVVDVFFHGILPDQEDAFRTLAGMLGERSEHFRTYSELFPE